MKKLLFVLSVIWLAASGNLKAQVEEPVKWTVKVKEINKWEVQVIAHATVEQGWKLYGLNVPADGPFPTNLVLEESDNYRAIKTPVEVTAAHVKYDEVFDMDVPYFKEEATISQNVRITKRPAVIKGYMEFMCCNNEKCLPPTSSEFEIEVK
ncbi:hypothetical protein DMA11_08775 [Marinilabiliaceae bacterium JC017]|nr:hypothetical protein DMA11_08775 [Marinilabiliaceae bacterium JC017]